MEAFQARNLDLPEMATTAFQQALSIEPDDPAILMDLARCHIETGDIEAGRQAAARIRGVGEDESEPMSRTNPRFQDFPVRPQQAPVHMGSKAIPALFMNQRGLVLCRAASTSGSKARFRR